jgi:FkbM family methyltransferase
MLSCVTARQYDAFVTHESLWRHCWALQINAAGTVLLIDEQEQQLVQEFFGRRTGFFVEVGANDPFASSQSWHLEQRGWRGILIEPQPQLAKQLARHRRAKVVAAACSSPSNAGRRLSFYVAGAMSSLDREKMAPGCEVEAVIEVPIRTLDDTLLEGGAPQSIDFVSIDVEGHELEVLRGFDVNRWRPRLILLEDHVGDLIKHRFMKSIGYRLVRRTGYNGWYVPATSSAGFGWKDRLEVLRKYYFALPFRVLRNFSRQLRQPFKDRQRANRR